MPYISQQARAEIGRGRTPRNTGELTYLYTHALIHARDLPSLYVSLASLTQQYITRLTSGAGPLAYEHYCGILGSLTAAELEHKRRAPNDDHRKLIELRKYRDDFYRLRVAPFEDGKIESNGDIYP